MSAPANSESSPDRPRSSPGGSSPERTRVILLVVLVILVAVAAAMVTVWFSQRTYAPTERTLDPAIQVAAGSEHVDEQAGLVIRVPEGWQVQSGGLPLGSTLLVPDEGAGPGGQPQPAAGPGSLVLVGELPPEVAAAEPENERAAAGLAASMGEIFLPIPGQQVDPRVQELPGRAGVSGHSMEGVGVSYRVEPAEGARQFLPDGALVYSAVVGEADHRYWVTYIGAPADGSMSSPGPEWADEIAERLRPA